jgi:hypothetical protein
MLLLLMTDYEKWSLVLTGMYDLLTFLLLVFVAYEAVIAPRAARLAFYLQRVTKDTKSWSWRADLADFVLENRGRELSNLKVTSEPDYIGWGRFGREHEGKPTSEWFAEVIPYVGEGERRQFGWCELESNDEVAAKPFDITIEFDNPVLPWPRRVHKTFHFNPAALFKGTAWGVTGRYDVHNVAQEAARIREVLEGLSKLANRVAVQAARRDADEKEDI